MLSPQKHRSIHDAWMHGRRVPASLWPAVDDATVTVFARSRMASVRFAHQVSRSLQYEAGHDMATMPSDLRGANRERLEAILRIEGRRAVGFVVTLLSNETRQHVRDDGLERVAVLGIWVCHSRRRSGLGVDLVHAVQVARDVPENELAWVYPISEAGLALAKKFAIDGQIWIH